MTVSWSNLVDVAKGAGMAGKKKWIKPEAKSPPSAAAVEKADPKPATKRSGDMRRAAMYGKTK
jgi:hypothetical protein